MASKVVSTKLTEEEYGKLVGLCSSTGFTVSKLLKRAILERIREDPIYQRRLQKTEAARPKESNEIVQKKKITPPSNDDRFLYY